MLQEAILWTFMPVKRAQHHVLEPCLCIHYSLNLSAMFRIKQQQQWNEQRRIVSTRATSVFFSSLCHCSPVFPAISS